MWFVARRVRIGDCMSGWKTSGACAKLDSGLGVYLVLCFFYVEHCPLSRLLKHSTDTPMHPPRLQKQIRIQPLQSQSRDRLSPSNSYAKAADSPQTLQVLSITSSVKITKVVAVALVTMTKLHT